MTRERKLIITVVSVTISLIVIFPLDGYKYTYGWYGELELQIYIDDTVLTLGLDNSFNATYVLKNIGKTTVRVLPFSVNFSPHAYYPNGSAVRFNGSIGGAAIFTDHDLIEIHPGKKIQYCYQFSFLRWDFSTLGNYSVDGVYFSHRSNRDSITLPIWEGRLTSSSADLRIEAP